MVGDRLHSGTGEDFLSKLPQLRKEDQLSINGAAENCKASVKKKITQNKNPHKTKTYEAKKINKLRGNLHNKKYLSCPYSIED